MTRNAYLISAVMFRMLSAAFLLDAASTLAPNFGWGKLFSKALFCFLAGATWETAVYLSRKARP